MELRRHAAEKPAAARTFGDDPAEFSFLRLRQFRLPSRVFPGYQTFGAF